MLDWLKRYLRVPTVRQQRAVDFLGEQDGVPERELKAALYAVLEAEPRIRAAYLARVTYENGIAPGVALCLRGDLDEPSQLIHAIGQIFAARFGAKENLDILFLTLQDEVLLQTVCSAFFQRAA